MERPKYKVRAERVEQHWECYVEGVGATKANKITEVEDTVRYYISSSYGVEQDSFDIVTYILRD